MPAATRQPGPDVGGACGVVEHQQPAVPPVQLGQHRGPHHLGTRPERDTPQRRPEGGELVADQPRLLGIDPPGQVMTTSEPVRGSWATTERPWALAGWVPLGYRHWPLGCTGPGAGSGPGELVVSAFRQAG